MKVAILSPYPTFPFAHELGCPAVSYLNNATWTVALADHLATIPDTEVHVVTESEEVLVSKTIARGNLSVHFLKAPGRFKTLTLWQADCRRMHRLLHEIQPDVVHGQGLENQYGFAAVTSGFPHLLTIHGIPRLSNASLRIKPFNRQKIVEFLAVLCLNRAQNIVVIDPFVEQYYQDLAARKRLFHIPNALGSDFFNAAPATRDDNLVLSVGAIDRRKAHDVLLRSIAQMPAAARPRVIIAGPEADREYVQALRQLSREHALQVEFTGFVTPAQVGALMRRCTIFVLPSRHETAPVALCEAMALGTPVIAAAVGGTPNMVRTGETGLLFESENVNQLTQKIRYLLDNDPARHRLAEQAAQYARQTYHPDRVARLTRAAYEEILTYQPAADAVSDQSAADLRFSVLRAVRRSDFLMDGARQLLAVVPLRHRFGADFWRWYAFYNESERWPAERLAEYQFQQLRVLLQQLAHSSDFYRQRLAKVDIAGLRALEDFQAQVPLLSRNEFRKHYAQVRAADWQRQRLSRSQTSGTTGRALQFYHAAADQRREWAAICHQWRRVGYIPGVSRRAEFRGLTRPGQLTQVFPEQNMIRCSVLHLRESHVRHYAAEIRRHRANFFHGYPSALYLLAQTICRHALEFPQPEAILLASEQVHDWQLPQIEAAFPRAKIFAHYGCAERTVLGAWCESRREYHSLPQYALVEIAPVTNEIIGTNLFNTVNGFVRYRMSDTALATATGVCPDCGRAYSPRLTQLGGRIEDYLFSAERGWIPPAIVTYALKSLHSVSEVQIVQRERAVLCVRYTVTPDASAPAVERERADIQESLLHLFGAATRVEFERVENFPRTASGKFRWIVCQLDEMRAVVPESEVEN